MAEWWGKYKNQVAMMLVALILVGVAFLVLFFNQQKEPQLEIISSQQEEQEMIFIHLSGAVEKPGVYEMPAESRLNDLLIRAGGLSAQADREWVSQNLNLAQKLTDGAKILIPKQGEAQTLFPNQSSSPQGKINLNRASLSQLESLWGIGAKRAQDIIDNRPYQTVEDLVTRKIIPQSVFEKIKDEIAVY
ncbi:hypothetical protein FJZ41_02525 [Candidatus Shapirobacteria bacterium]|nr:hypothetical protein [Candidatus Shapirobacteria bacterium]